MVYRVCILVILMLYADYVGCLQDLDGYIIEVDSDCSTLAKDSPVLHILTDYSISAKARCVKGDKNFTHSDNVHHSLEASFKSGTKKCQFEKRHESYFIEVIVMYGGNDAKILRNEKTYTVVCTFQDNGLHLSGKNKIIEGSVVPGEIVNAGTNISSSKITVNIQDVLNKDITGNLSTDTWISLMAASDGKDGEVGITPVSCDLVSGKKGKRFNILRSGCSHGQWFDKGTGFITTGLITRSPYFKPVIMDDDKTVEFECKFSLCSTNCDGSSCTGEVFAKKKVP